MLVDASAAWLFPLLRWAIETFIPTLYMGIYGIDSLTAMLESLRPILPMSSLGVALLQWTAVSALKLAAVIARMVLKTVAAANHGAW